MPPKKKAKAKKKTAAVPCPDNVKQICRDLNGWASEWEAWGLKVKKKVTECCGNGDPEPLPSPPKPPFK